MAKYEVEAESKKKIITVINALLPEAKIYLFGSRARGTNVEWSDIDLALDTGKKIDRRRVFEVSNVIEALSIPYKVDVVDIHGISEELRKAIERSRVLWMI